VTWHPEVRERERSQFRGGWLAFAVSCLILIVIFVIRVLDMSAQHSAFKAILGTLQLLGLLLSGAWPLHAWLSRRHKIKLQRTRDAEALSSDFRALFLRPFFLDKNFLFANPFWSPFCPETKSLAPPEFVGRVLESYINVVQFGGESDEVSNARISMPDSSKWEPLFTQQVDHASVVVIIPLLRYEGPGGRPEGEATMWELDYLVRSFALERTIAIMPTRARGWIAESWERARMRAVKLGVNFPEYSRSGDVMTFEYHNGNWRVVAGFCGSWKGRERLAAGLVAATKSLSERHRFTLLAR
jgi:hypothetical protein